MVKIRPVLWVKVGQLNSVSLTDLRISKVLKLRKKMKHGINNNLFLDKKKKERIII